MTIRAYRAAMIDRLSTSGSPDPVADAEWLLCDALNISRSTLRLRGEERLTENQIVLLDQWLSRREAGEPLQYIEGFAEFMGLRLSVDPRVLIPRQDTETLCEWAIETIRDHPDPMVLDLCTGSGALAVSIAKLVPRARVTAADLSADALAVARQNAAAHHVAVEFLQGDLFSPVEGRQFDLIVCNPPYLTEGEMHTLQREVRREPALALEGGVDGLLFYQRIANDAAAHLKPGGSLALEVGAEQAKPVRDLLFAALPGARIGTALDLNGIERVVWLKTQL